jgi:hypothetical protein
VEAYFTTLIRKGRYEEFWERCAKFCELLTLRNSDEVIGLMPFALEMAWGLDPARARKVRLLAMAKFMESLRALLIVFVLVLFGSVLVAIFQRPKPTYSTERGAIGWTRHRCCQPR